MRYALDSSKIRALGWEPQRNFEEGLSETVAWYQANRAWWTKIKGKPQFQSYLKKQYAERARR